MQEKNDGKSTAKRLRLADELEYDQILFYWRIAKSNLRKAISLEFFGLVLIGLGLTFPGWLLSAARYGLIKPPGPELLPRSSWVIVAPLILLGGYVAYKSFLLLLAAVYQVRKTGDLLKRKTRALSEAKQIQT